MPQPLQAGDYYYNSQGLMVFTEQYHLRRGSCCGSGCRHCPWQGGSLRNGLPQNEQVQDAQKEDKKDMLHQNKK